MTMYDKLLKLLKKGKVCLITINDKHGIEIRVRVVNPKVCKWYDGSHFYTSCFLNGQKRNPSSIVNNMHKYDKKLGFTISYIYVIK